MLTAALASATRRRRPGPVFQFAGVVARAAPERQPPAQPARLQDIAQRVGDVARAAEGDLLAGRGAAHLDRGPAPSAPGCIHRDSRRERTSSQSSGRSWRHSLGKSERCEWRSTREATRILDKSNRARLRMETAKRTRAIHRLAMCRADDDAACVKTRGRAAPAPSAWPAAWSWTPPPTASRSSRPRRTSRPGHRGSGAANRC